jgi:hypothetical protein
MVCEMDVLGGDRSGGDWSDRRSRNNTFWTLSAGDRLCFCDRLATHRWNESVSRLSDIFPLHFPIEFDLIAGAKTADYYSAIACAVYSLGNNTPAARQQLYERARSALADLLGKDASELELARERLALEMVIQRIETDAPASQSDRSERPETVRALPKQTRPRRPSPLHGFHVARKDRAVLHPAFQRASTVLLFIAMFFPGLWITDLTSMSLYWVARANLGSPR